MLRMSVVVLTCGLLLPITGCLGTLKTEFQPGDYDMSIAHGGVMRTFKLHVPKKYCDCESAALVLMFHGGAGSAEQAAADYGWNEKSDAVGFVVAYPDGTGLLRTWNAMHCCGAALRADVDDVNFVATLISHLQRTLNIDRRRIYATGMSNGAMLVHRLAAERSDLFAAIAPVAGSVGGRATADSEEVWPPTPSEAVPAIIFHGQEDQHVLYDGGQTLVGTPPGRVDISAMESAYFWVEANGCEPDPVSTVSTSGNVVRDTWCPAVIGGDVILYSIVDQGHAWPGSKKRRPGADSPSQEIDATALIWDFFEAHPKP